MLIPTPYRESIVALLRVIEAGVDTLSFGLVGAVPVCSGKLVLNQSALSLNFALAEKSYAF